MRFDLFKNEDIVVKEFGFTCKDKKVAKEEEKKKYEVLACMIVDEFASNKADTDAG